MNNDKYLDKDEFEKFMKCVNTKFNSRNVKEVFNAFDT